MRTKQITFQIPTISIDFSSYINRVFGLLRNFITSVKDKILTLHFTVPSLRRKRQENYQIDSELRPKRRFKLPGFNKKIIGATLVGLVVILLVVFVSSFSGVSRDSENADNRVDVAGVKSFQDINREFTFPLTDDSGEEVGNIKYLIESAELRNQIIVNGQKATSIKGRTFLIINLKISNDYSQSVEINTRDYMRLSVNGDKDEWLAPDIHNDPVEVQAISTKNTRLGFPINEADKDLILRVGEIDGEKEEIELSL